MKYKLKDRAFSNKGKKKKVIKGGIPSMVRSYSKGEGKFQVGDIVYNTRTNTVGIVRLPEDKYGEVKTDADGNVDVDELVSYDKNNKDHKNAAIAPSTKREIGKNFAKGNLIDVEEALDGYLSALVFADEERVETDYYEDNGEDYPHSIDSDEINEESKKRVRKYIEGFLKLVDAEDQSNYLEEFDSDDFGRDLYYTSAGHGVGFWDRSSEASDKMNEYVEANERNRKLEFSRGSLLFIEDEETGELSIESA